MSEKKKITFRFKKNGKSEYEVQGAPGAACLDAKEDIAPLLESIGIKELDSEATNEAHVHAGKPSESHNNL